MLNNLTQPHDYPGKLFVVEGIDGSGKTTQLGLRHRMELVRTGEGGDENGQEEKRPDPDDVQPAPRHGFR
jgi:hypothetical protein